MQSGQCKDVENRVNRFPELSGARLWVTMPEPKEDEKFGVERGRKRKGVPFDAHSDVSGLGPKMQSMRPAASSQNAFAEPAMVRIPEGWFLMGSYAGQDNERPVHRVWIDAFELAVCQVTNADYACFLAAASHRKPLHWEDPIFSHPEQPVVAPSWFDAVAYCDWLSRSTGRRYRLPSEAEWERAARGGLEQKAYPWGDEPPESLQNYALRWKATPERVGRAERNTYGVCDIGANVHEWCSDWFSADYYAASPEGNPQGPSEGTRRSSRGGSWRHYTKVSRCAARSSVPPEFQYADYGFRVARDVSG